MAQALATHEGTAWASAHALPQAPQSFTSMATWVSQPSRRRSPLQSAQPISHRPVHCAAAHRGMGTWFFEQAAPHIPQWTGSMPRSTSHPSLRRSALQSAKPIAQVPVQAPPLQPAATRWLPEQAIRQPPQLTGSASRWASQPSLRWSWLQSAQPASHAPVQRPPEHAGAGTGGARRMAVLGCGAVGLATARTLQRRGVEVTVYTEAMPENTTSAVAGAQCFPFSVFEGALTGAFRDDFVLAAELSYRAWQSLVGDLYGVRWMANYLCTDHAPREDGLLGSSSPIRHLLPELKDLGASEHPFLRRYVRRFQTMMIEPAVYLPAALRDVLAGGSRIVVRRFETVADVVALPEPVVINCTGLGSRDLFGDAELTPVKGQLTVLLPQPEVDYAVLAGNLYMFSRRDGVLLGGTYERGVGTLEPNQEARKAILDGHERLFEPLLDAARKAAHERPSILLRGLVMGWCPRTESNRRHGDFQSPALPAELPGRCEAEDVAEGHGGRQVRCLRVGARVVPSGLSMPPAPLLFAAAISVAQCASGGGASCGQGGPGATATATSAAALRRAIFTSLQPACDALGLSDEDGEVAAREVMANGEGLTPLAGFDNRDCEVPDRPPAVVDCNDARASVWLHEMVGTCDMPSVYGPRLALASPSSLRPAPRERSREAAALCLGHTCTSDPAPLRSHRGPSDHGGWLALAAGVAAPRPAPPRRLSASDDDPPESLSRPPPQRPPIG